MHWFQPILYQSSPLFQGDKYVMLCAIRYYLYNLRNVKHTHGGVLLFVKLQAESCNFTKSSTPPPWVFFMFFELYKWYQIVQSFSCTKRAILEERLRYSNLRLFWFLELIQVVRRSKTRGPLRFVSLLTPKLPSYRNQWIDLLCKSIVSTSV